MLSSGAGAQLRPCICSNFGSNQFRIIAIGLSKTIGQNPWKENLNVGLVHLRELGFTQNLKLKYKMGRIHETIGENQMSSSDLETPQVKMESLMLTFLLYCIGLVLAGAVFVFEYLFSKTSVL